jgi:hypothetical protein
MHGGVGIATGYKLDDLCLIPSMVRFFLPSVQNSSVVHPASYPMGTEGFFPKHKMADNGYILPLPHVYMV